jgi:hypothetical protein
MHPESKPESWDHLIALVQHWPHQQEPALRLLRQARALGLDQYFRAGQSHFHLLFSTNVIYPSADPHVTLIFRSTDNLIVVSYGEGWISEGRQREAELYYLLPYEEAFATFLRFLKQVWINTMPEAVPPMLRDITAPVLLPESRSLFELLESGVPSPLLDRERKTA